MNHAVKTRPVVWLRGVSPTSKRLFEWCKSASAIIHSRLAGFSRNYSWRVSSVSVRRRYNLPVRAAKTGCEAVLSAMRRRHHRCETLCEGSTDERRLPRGTLALDNTSAATISSRLLVGSSFLLHPIWRAVTNVLVFFEQHVYVVDQLFLRRFLI